ncbi:MAG: D-alanine--D-alanine ligase [Thermoleophilia bacterium]|nr:D-alanine--D-alanine ligase [Thermoleophilia bacterium]
MKAVVLSGGRSSEHEISLVSGQAVATGLVEAGHEVINVEIAKDGTWTSGGEPVAIVPGAGLLGADVAFPVLHGPFGEDGATQGTLETARVAYVGSDVLGSAVCMDKLTLKRLCGFAGMPQVDFVQAFTPGWQDAAADLDHPLWVKPSRLGSSVGITKVEGGREELEEAVAAAAQHDPRVIIEANSSGREVECSVLGNVDPETSMPGEILSDGDWYDYEAKYTEGRMNLAVPAEIGDEATAELRRLAAEVFTLAGCAGLARCDFFVEDDGSILLNEVNTIPGFTQTSVYAKLWEASGLSYPDLLTRLIGLAVERHTAEAGHSF